MSFTTFIVASLATYRLTLLISSEGGPYNILERFRYFIGVRFDAYSKPYGTNTWARGVLCPYCLSVWIAAVITGVLYLAPQFEPVVWVFALSGVVVALKKWMG